MRIVINIRENRIKFRVLRPSTAADTRGNDWFVITIFGEVGKQDLLQFSIKINLSTLTSSSYEMCDYSDPKPQHNLRIC